METKIISGFPGVGKTKACNIYDDPYNGFFVVDSDSSKFPKDTFPQNYIEHIFYVVNVDKPTILFVSSHEEVRRLLVEHNFEFTLVFPNKNLMGEYIQRFTDRGNDKKFIEMVIKNWSEWIDSCQNQKGCMKFELQAGKYLTDFIGDHAALPPNK